MSDLFGLLPLPWLEAGCLKPDREPAGDPALAVLLSFMKAVVNHDLGRLWAQICPTDPVPVKDTFWHNPDPTTFSEARTPAIYAWRTNAADKSRYAQGYTSDETPIQCLWVPPPMKQENSYVAQPFSQALKSCLKDAFVVGRHPAWKVKDDTYFNPELLGSVLLKHAGLSRIEFGDFKPFELPIEFFDVHNPRRLIYDCWAFKLDTLTLLERDPTRRYAVPQTQMQSTLQLGDDPTQPDITQTAIFKVVLDSVDPPIGSHDGGDVVTLSGSQLVDGMIVLFGSTPSPEVVFVDESTLQARTPAHVVGAADITVSAPHGSANLPNAFTFI